MSKIEKIRDDLYIKKGWDGYRVVFPIKKDPSKPYTIGKRWDNVHWKNLTYGGHWSRLVKLLFFLLALYLFVQAYLADTKTCREFVENIDKVCLDYIGSSQPVIKVQDISPYNLSSINPMEINEDT